MAQDRKFIIAECADGDHHVVAIDEIKNISPRTDPRDGLVTKIVLKSDQLLYTTEKPRELLSKITKAQRAR